MIKENEKKIDDKKATEVAKPELEKISSKDLSVIAVGTGAIGGHRIK
jgi:hypothetical protein